MKNESDEPFVATPARTPLPHLRHDGWTGNKMATFLETLAETAVVAEACEQAHMGVSGAYAHRRRSPVFAAAWDAALTIARERLADTLLARSMEGNVEQLYKDGELIGERHLLDNRLGLAILKRLDRLAETGTTVSTRGERLPFPGGGRGPGGAQHRAPAILPRSASLDWEMLVGALRTGDPDDVARALAVLKEPALSLSKGDEVEEVEDPPVTLSPDAEGDNFLDLTDRCWLDGVDEIWMTDFPPPADFTGYESRPYDEDDPDEPYVRACSPEEIAILEADDAAARAAERAKDEQLRDAWFQFLKDEAQDRRPGPFDAACGVAQDRPEPGSAFASAAAKEGQE